MYADSAYVGKEAPANVKNNVCEKGYRSKALTAKQKAANREKSKNRARVEHVFEFMTISMRGFTVRSIGIRCAKFNIGFANLVYNLCRFSALKRKGIVRG